MNVLEQIRQSLTTRADINHDGKIDRRDIEAALAPLEAKARLAVLVRPLGLLLTGTVAFLVGCVVGWLVK